MGMYTELVMACVLKKDTPEDVIKILQYMCGVDGMEIGDLKIPTNHNLFITERWELMLVCDSYYFSPESHTTFNFDEISQDYRLTVRSNFKNYDDEITKFLNWLSPYMSDQGFLGYEMHESVDFPTLIFRNPDGKILYESTAYPMEGEF